MVQSTVHVCFTQTSRVASVRFSFFTVQLASFFVLMALIIRRAWASS